MEALALNFALYAAKSVLTKFEGALSEELGLLDGVEVDIQFIMDELESISAFLHGLSVFHELDDQVRTWMKQVKELAFDAEDAVDVFAPQIGKPWPLEVDHDHPIIGFLFHNVHLLWAWTPRHLLAQKLRGIKLRVEQVSLRRSRYDLKSLSPAAASTPAFFSEDDVQHDPRTALFVDKDKLEGVEERSEELAKWLMEQANDKLAVISMVGSGGAGKSTLAEHVYHSRLLAGSSFQQRAWITVSKFQFKELLLNIIRVLFTEQIQHFDKLGEDELLTKIKEYLQGKRYLIVLDDLWTVETWNKLKRALVDNGLGSRIVVTTRVQMVADHCRLHCGQASHLVEVKGLSDVQSRSLFSKIVFQSADGCPEDLRDVMIAILSKCGRLPLAIVTIAAVLAAKIKSRAVWKKVSERIGPEMEEHSSLRSMKRVLVLSYHDLPYPLKPCFMSLSVFPENHRIKSGRLARLWMAEEFVTDKHYALAEEVAEDYLNGLVGRRLIDPSKVGVDGKAKICRVHSIMLEVVLSMAIEENFATVLDEHSIEALNGNGKIRRLSIHGQSKLERKPDLSHARYLHKFGSIQPKLDYSKMRLLRVLDLEGSRDISYRDLDQITEMTLLKYLSLRGTSICWLPESIGKLKNLQTLDIRETKIDELPVPIVQLENLTYFLAGKKVLDRRGWQFAIPSNGLKFPKGLKKLKGIRILGVVNGDSNTMKELGELTKLRKLTISGETTKEARKNLIKSLLKLSQSLRSLSIYDRISSSVSSLASLPTGKAVDLPQKHQLSPVRHSLPPPPPPPLSMLQTLKLVGHLGKFPDWLSKLDDLMKITLMETRLKETCFGVLKKLPRLAHLVLGWNAFNQENLIFGKEGFRHLKILCLDDFGADFEYQALPKLESLIIRKYNDMSFSDISGIEHLMNLKKLDLDIFNFAVKFKLLSAAERHPKHPEVQILQAVGKLS